MLRNLFIFLSKSTWLQYLVKKFPLARKVALRFVAGETLDSAISAVKVLNQDGKVATLDMLGEDTDTEEIATKITDSIIEVINEINKIGVKSGVSLKLNQIGLGLNETICANNLKRILAVANKINLFVRVDIEDSPVVDKTFAIVRSMEKDYGFKNVGTVVQSYLYRTAQDTKELMNDGFRIRIVKGAYNEPASVAFPHKRDTDDNFDLIVTQMLEHTKENDTPPISDDGIWPPFVAIASHDPQRIEHAKKIGKELGIPNEKIEFQMLYGIGRELQKSLVNEGYPVRVYVPFGDQWYPYFMRRLAERPANIFFFISSLFRK